SFNAVTSYEGAAQALLEADRHLTGGRNVTALRKALTWHGLLGTVSEPLQFSEADVQSRAISMESPHPIDDNADGQLVIDQPGAAGVRVRFASLDFELDDGCT